MTEKIKGIANQHKWFCISFIMYTGALVGFIMQTSGKCYNDVLCFNDIETEDFINLAFIWYLISVYPICRCCDKHIKSLAHALKAMVFIDLWLISIFLIKLIFKSV